MCVQESEELTKGEQTSFQGKWSLEFPIAATRSLLEHALLRCVWSAVWLDKETVFEEKCISMVHRGASPCSWSMGKVGESWSDSVPMLE